MSDRADIELVPASKSSARRVRVYDKAMCCPTGVCGPTVDPALPRFAADLDWLREEGHDVERFNLAQQPEAFAANAQVQSLLKTEGVGCLPLIVVDDRVVSRSEYPSRDQLASWTGTARKPAGLPVASRQDCCGDTGCC